MFQNGTGPYSDWISVDTPLTEKDESVLGAPRELTARATSDSISLRWIPPADESVLVRGYQVISHLSIYLIARLSDWMGSQCS